MLKKTGKKCTKIVIFTLLFFFFLLCIFIFKFAIMDMHNFLKSSSEDMLIDFRKRGKEGESEEKKL